MKPLYQVNGLVHWDQTDISSRDRMQAQFAESVTEWLRSVNLAWRVDRVEAPIMIPRALINPNYTNDDLWVFHKHSEHEPELIARPETTPSTYAWMVDQLHGHNKVKFPWCVWQSGKSFRAETDHVLKHMRLKEFYQMEFQCAYSAETANDYHSACLEPVRHMIGSALGLPTRVIPSDRLPSYSLSTMDIEVYVPDRTDALLDETLDPHLISASLTGSAEIPARLPLNPGRWMEVCSISKRIDFPVKHKYQAKNKDWKEVDIMVLEIAIGLDRCVSAKSISDLYV